MPIAECGEPLAVLPAEKFHFVTPHPYVALGAPYGGVSPWYVRAGVLAALLAAQAALEARQPGYRLKLFDAYRPNSVQHFMVEREFALLAGGRTPLMVQEPERSALYERVYRLWAIPSADPATPPPHSTGAALDLTIADAAGQELDMGSPIDENSERSNPDYYAAANPAAHGNRLLLRAAMGAAGFARHPAEWWHFSLGDQLWAWLLRQENPQNPVMARYGRADLLAGGEKR